MENDEKALDHAWNYFQLHANQRVTVFNYYVVFSGLLVTGMVATTQTSPSLAFVGVVSGLLLSVLSYVFFRLDERVSFLIKNAENVIKKLEPSGASIFSDEVEQTTAAAKQKGLWTYGKAFRTMFITMGLIGLVGAGYSGFRWGKGDAAPSQITSEETADVGES
ncbi:MAG: hypothetical protein JKY94_08770 [Rhodobacteraceae bacterium]|nr:hypothetical protein [Paracoccaceae bacterium]